VHQETELSVYELYERIYNMYTERYTIVLTNHNYKTVTPIQKRELLTPCE